MNSDARRAVQSLSWPSSCSCGRALDRQRAGSARRVDRGSRPHRHRSRAGRRVAERLAPLTIARAVSSPLQRCLETASVALAGHDVRPRRPARRVPGYGGFTGRSLADAAKDPLWRVVQQTRGRHLPARRRDAAESLAQIGAARRWWSARARRRGGGRARQGCRVVAVSHGDPIKAVVAEAVGGRLAVLQRVRVDPGSLTAVHPPSTGWCCWRTTPCRATFAPLVARPAHAPSGDSVGRGRGRLTRPFLCCEQCTTTPLLRSSVQRPRPARAAITCPTASSTPRPRSARPSSPPV